MDGAAVVAEILKREGTEFIACYPRNPLIEACARIGIRTILSRQERVGVGIADGYSRTTQGRKIGVFAAQAGPGIENSFPGAAQAFSEGVPVLIITGIREQIAFLFPGEPIHPRFVPVDELVEKPVEPKMLLEKVNRLLQAAEARKARAN